MVAPKYRVQICTWNGNLKGLEPTSLEDSSSTALTDWLIPTLSQTSSSNDDEKDEKSSVPPPPPPDIIGIGFQEMIPLHLSLIGLTTTVLNLHEVKLKQVIESHVTSSEEGSETYTLVAKEILGGIALLVYTRDSTLTFKVQKVQISNVGVGLLNLMGNKGAVGVRITVDQSKDEVEANLEKEEEEVGEEGEGTVYTLVTAHLAAHDHGLERRHQDWKSIVSRLIFTEDNLSTVFVPPRKEFSSLLRKREEVEQEERISYIGIEGIQMYDTSYLFFFGDLNYRISTTTPKPLPLHLISHKLMNDLPSLLLQDQLKSSQSQSLTLHHLKEGLITFTPTYKFIPGTINQYKTFTKRVPGWCDRILYLTWANGENGAGLITKVGKEGGGGEEKVVKRKGAKVELYRSIMEFVTSDHKPVTAIISLPRLPPTTTTISPLRLPFKSPFPIDPLWRRKQTLGWILNRFIGFWALVFFIGLGSKEKRIGLMSLIGVGVGSWWFLG